MRRLAQTVPVLILVSMIVFGLMRAIPGDPAVVLLGPNARPEQITEMRARMGLDQPIWTQYAVWAGHMARGDFGESFLNGFAVRRLITMRAAATVQLAVAATLFALLVAVPLGMLAALRQGTWLDHAVNLYAGLALGIPNFWLGILLVLVFALTLHTLPPSGYAALGDGVAASLRFFVMPTVTLGVHLSAVLLRFIRSALLEALHQDYVRTARAKGLGPRMVVGRHVFRNALIPIITLLGLQFGGLLGGTMIVEAIFDWPGLGRLLIQAIQTRDYSVVQALILLGAGVYVLINLGTDLLYGALDPRIRRG